MFKVPVIQDKLGYSSKAFGDLLFILKLQDAEIQSRSKLTFFSDQAVTNCGLSS